MKTKPRSSKPEVLPRHAGSRSSGGEIRSSIARVKRRIRTLEAATIGLALATFTLVFLATEILIDRVFILDRGVRLTAFWAYLVVAAGCLLLALALVARPLSDLYAARLIERHFPALKQSLITYVQMSAGQASGSDYALRLIEDRLLRDLENVDLGPVVRSRLLTLAATGAIVVAVFLGTSGAVAGRGFLVCLERAALPYRSVPPPTKTRIVEIAPGDQVRLCDTEFEVRARMEGRTPDEARVYVAFEDGAWFYVAMTGSGGDWTAVLPGAQSSFRYFVAAADTRSDICGVRVLPPPALSEVRATIEPPSYTGVGRKVVAGGDIEALPGSYIILRGVPNRAIRSAVLVFETGERVPARVNGAEPLLGEFTAEKSAAYRIELEDEYGLKNPSPQSFRLQVAPDRPPEVTIVNPPPLSESGPDDEIELTIDAIDDYGVSDVTLVTRRRGGAVRRRSLPLPVEGKVTVRYRPAELELAPSHSMLYFVEARDRAMPPHQARSAIHVLHCRLRPLDGLAAYDDLQQALLDLAADPKLREQFGIEGDIPPDEAQVKARDEALKKLRELLDAQGKLTDDIRKLDAETARGLDDLRDDLRRLMKEMAQTAEKTRDLPSRSLQRQPAIADQLARDLNSERQRMESLQRRVQDLAAQKDAGASRRKILPEAAKRLEAAAKLLDAARRRIEETMPGDSLDRQNDAAAQARVALNAVNEQLSAELPESLRIEAQRLADRQKLLREWTEELRKLAEQERSEALQKAQRAMDAARRELQQNQPAEASDSAQDAAEDLKKAEEQLRKDEEEEAPPLEPPDEVKEALAAQLRRILRSQNAINDDTKAVHSRRAAVLSAEARTKLEAMGKTQDGVARQIRKINTGLADEAGTDVYLWVLERVESDMFEVRELLAERLRTDAHVTDLEDRIVARLQELIDALKPAQREGGGGGGGGGGAARLSVGLAAQLKMIRTMQKALEERTVAIRGKHATADALTDIEREVLDGVALEQEDLRRLALKIVERLKE